LKSEQRNGVLYRALGKLPGFFWETLIHSVWSPLIVIPFFVIAFLAPDTYDLMSSGSTLWDAVAHPGAHIFWERVVIVGMLSAIGLAWQKGVSERQRRLDEIEAYQQRLHVLTTQLAAGEAEERRTLATRLHEDLSQQLTAGRLFLAGVQSPEEEQSREALETIARILDGVIADCRDIAETLSPPVLDQFGLPSAIEALVARARRRTGVNVVVDATADTPAIDADIAGVTFQVAAEVLGLAMADRRCTSMKVACSAQPGSAVLEFDWNASAESDFFSARQRISGIGGQFLLGSTPDRTYVQLSVPASAA